MLLTNAEGRKRILKDAALILFAILMLVSIAVVISEFETGGHSTVYAVDSSSNEGSRQSQMGLTGVVTGVADMEKYSEATRLIRMDGAKGATLAGACGLDRRAIRKRQIASGTTNAKELGYYAQQTIQENQMSGEEYYTLLQIVEAEATGGDVMSKMMVAGVVLNRVKDSHFPDTIQEVVWQDDQFQPTSDGRIYSCSVTDSTILAVERVLQGEDYTQGALFFLARGSAEQKNTDWFDANLTKLFEYGGHEYYTYRDEAEATAAQE